MFVVRLRELRLRIYVLACLVGLLLCDNSSLRDDGSQHRRLWVNVREGRGKWCWTMARRSSVVEHGGLRLRLLSVESRYTSAQVLGALFACFRLKTRGVLAHGEERVLAMVVEEVTEGRCRTEGGHGMHFWGLRDVDNKR